MEKLAYTPRELAQAASISLGQLYALWREGKGPPYKTFGKRGKGELRRIERGDAIAWMKDRGE